MPTLFCLKRCACEARADRLEMVNLRESTRSKPNRS